MDALVFSWSGSFRDAFADREAAIQDLVGVAHDRGMEVGLVANAPRAEAAEEVASVDVDFVIGEVDNIVDVLSSLTTRYGKVFFVSDVRAELAAVNQSGAFTIGVESVGPTAEEMGGVGPNYLVDDLGEIEQLLVLEALDD